MVCVDWWMIKTIQEWSLKPSTKNQVTAKLGDKFSQYYSFTNKWSNFHAGTHCSE